jgi:Uma2 family endonuclease
MSVELKKRLFSVYDYHRMAEAGILGEHDRVELIEGEIVAMSPIGPPHNAAVNRANRAMVNAVGDRAIVQIQGSVRLNNYNEPQPDVVLMRPRADFYSTRHAMPADILLIVEVAQSSLEYDRTLKACLYARTGIAEYWVADLTNDCVFAYSNPGEGEYHTIREFKRGESIAPQLLPECQIQVDTLLA